MGKVLRSLTFILLFWGLTGRNFIALAEHQSGDIQSPPVILGTVSGACAVALLTDDFNGTLLDASIWDIYRGIPIVNDGWLTLPGAEIQSKATYTCGTLSGVIQSTDWKSQQEFTDSSFGFEIWTGADSQCHYGVTFKASGHLAVLNSVPDSEGNCEGDPLYQAYVAIQDWDTIRASETIFFTLTYSNTVTLTVQDSFGNTGVAPYTGLAIPSTPLKIRLYAHTFEPGLFETFSFDFIGLSSCPGNCLPFIFRTSFLPPSPSMGEGPGVRLIPCYTKSPLYPS